MLATHDGILKSMDLHKVNAVCRRLGCPIINEAGMYLHKKTGDKIKIGEAIATLYALDETKLALGIELLNEKNPFDY